MQSSTILPSCQTTMLSRENSSASPSPSPCGSRHCNSHHRNGGISSVKILGHGAVCRHEQERPRKAEHLPGPVTTVANFESEKVTRREIRNDTRIGIRGAFKLFLTQHWHAVLLKEIRWLWFWVGVNFSTCTASISVLCSTRCFFPHPTVYSCIQNS